MGKVKGKVEKKGEGNGEEVKAIGPVAALSFILLAIKYDTSISVSDGSSGCTDTVLLALCNSLIEDTPLLKVSPYLPVFFVVDAVCPSVDFGLGDYSLVVAHY